MASGWLEEFRKENGYRGSSSQNEDNGKRDADSSKKNSSAESSWLEQFRKENGYIGNSPSKDKVDDYNHGVDVLNYTLGSWNKWYDASRSGLEGVGFGDAGDASAAIKDESASMLERLGQSRKWAQENKDLLGDNYDSIMKMLQEATTGTYWVNKGYEGKVEDFSQWGSQAEYDQYQADVAQRAEAEYYGTPGAMADAYDAWKKIGDARAAYDDLDEIKRYQMAGYGSVPEEEREALRTQHEQRLAEITETYGVTSPYDLMDLIYQMEEEYGQLQGQISDAKTYQAGAAQPSGKTTENLTAEEYASELAGLDDSIASLDNYIKVLQARSEELGNIEFTALQYGSDEDRKKYETLMKELEGVQSQLTSAMEEYDSLMSRKWQMERDARFKTVRENEDFDDYSGYVVNQADDQGNVTRTVDDQLYRYINSRGGELFPFIREDHKKEDYDWIEKNVAQYSKYTMMTDAEIEDLNYIYRTQGKKAASDYITWLSPALDARAMGDLQEDMAEMTANAPIWANALSVPLMLSGGIGYLDVAAQNAAKKLTGSYQPINYNSTNMIPTMAGQTIRGTTAAMITDATGTIQLDEEKHPYLAPILNGRGLADVYSLGMSGLDSKVAALTGNPALATTLLASSAATQGVLDALERGATDEQALTMGFWTGAFEALFEYAEVDNLLKGEPNAVKNVINQMVTEGLGEGFTDVANSITDAFLLADKSAIMTAAQEYLAQNPGMTENEAIWKAVGDAAIDAGWSMVGGAASGGFAAGGQSMVQNYSGNMDSGRYVQQNEMGDPLMALARDMAGLGKVDTYAQRAAAKPSTLNMGKLYNEILRVSDRQDMDQLAQALVAQGVDEKDATKLASAISLKGADIELTKAQERLLERYESDERVMAAWMDVLGSDAYQKRNAGIMSLYRKGNGKVAITAQEAPGQAKATEAASVPEAKVETTHEVSEDGKTHLIEEPEKTVKIQGIESIKDGKMMLKLEDGSVVDSKEVSYSSDGEALIYSIMADMNVNPHEANRLIRSYDLSGDIDASAFALGIREAAYMFGQHNMPKAELESRQYASVLSQAQLDTAYKMGEEFGGKDTARKEAAVRKTRKAAEQKSSDKKTGQVHFDRKGRTFNDTQETALKVMEQMAKALGVEFYVFESYVNDSGKRVYKSERGECKAPNGFYDPATGAIHIDLNAGIDGKGTMLFTVAHELTHFIRQWSPAKFKTLAKFLFDYYVHKGQSVSKLVEGQIAKAKGNGRTIDWDTAYEEVVADSMEAMLVDGNVVQMMAELKQQDKGLWEKICDWFKDLVEDLKKLVGAYEGLKPDSPEGRMVADMQEMIVVFETLYAEALVEASENYRANEGNKKTTQEGGSVLQQARENKKHQASNSSPLSRRSVKQRSAGSTHPIMSSTAAAGILGISNIAEASEDVKRAVSVLGVIFESIGTPKPVLGLTKAIRGSNLESSLIETGILMPGGTGGSAYRKDGEHELRMSNHSAHAENFKGAGEHLSIALYKTAKVNKFLPGNQNVIEAVFKKDFLDRNPSVLKALIRDIARFIANGEYHDTAGAMKYNYSGSAEFVAGAKARMEADAKTRDDIKHSDREYLAAVERGDMATAQRMVYEAAKSSGAWTLPNGNVRKYYHGTSQKFTEFDVDKSRLGNHGFGIYLTMVKDFASDYGEPMSAYLFTDKIASNQDHRITTDQVQSVADHFGINLDSIKAGLADSNDASILQELQKAIVRETSAKPSEVLSFLQSTLGYDGLRVARETVLWDKYLVKSADPVTYDDAGNVIPLSERFDTTKSDIRYSERDAGAEKVLEALEKQNAKLKEDVSYLRELVRLQGKVTDGKVFRKSSIEAAASVLMGNAKARGDKAELAKLLEVFYDHIAGSEELSWESVIEAAQPAVDWLMEHEAVRKELDGFAQEVLREVRGSRFRLDDEQKQNAAYKYGSYNDYRKRMMGNAVVSDKANMTLDEWWHDMSGKFPSVFRPDVASTDMPEAFDEAMVKLRSMETDDGTYGYTQEMKAYDLMLEVYNSYWDVSTLKTVADVKQREIDALKAKHAKQVETIRKDHRAAMDKLRAEHRETLKAVRAELRKQALEDQKKIIDRAKEQRERMAENAEKRQARMKLDKLVLDTVSWIRAPKKGVAKCPDILKKPYMDFLNGIDTSSQRLGKGGDPTKMDLRMVNAMSALADTVDKITAGQDPGKDSNDVLDAGYLDLPADFVKKLRDMVGQIREIMENEGDRVINSMTAKEVRELSKLIKTLNHAIREMSTLYANQRFANAKELGVESVRFLDSLGQIKSTSGFTDFVNWQNALPYYAFKRFGTGGESVFEGLMDAQDKLAHLAKQIFDFQEKTWTGEEADAWSKDVHTIELADDMTEDGEVIKRSLTLTTADAMSIYCLYQREQGRKHLLGGGVRVIGIQKGSRKSPDSISRLTVEDIDTIIGSLTDRQVKVAAAMQKFMSTVCAEWGNEISMKRFLTREFTESDYFPIESDDENMTQKDPTAQQTDLFRLLNISATKGIDPNANNRAIVRNIFDVFIGHSTDMARLNAFALPLLDYMKWYNYREKQVTEKGQVINRGVRESMRNAYGDAAKRYVMNLIKDVNGRPSDGGLPSFYSRRLKNAKTAAVGSSLRVATLQITSYPRAALVLSPKSLAMGLTKVPNIKRAKEYCGIALWKSFGFYDTNIGRSIEDQMKGVKDVKQKLIELSLKGAEIGDAVTWGALWNACEYEVASTKKYEPGTKEFYEAVGKKLREVVYATQVVDSTLTRSEAMRSKDSKMKELTSFMSEPTLSANILMDAGLTFEMEKRRTGNAREAWELTKGYVGRALAVYSIGQIAAALMEAFWDAWRDDEDEEYWRKFVKAFGENLVLDILPFNKIPIVSDIVEAALSLVGLGYFSTDSLSSSALSQSVTAVKAWSDLLNGKSSATVYNALYKSMRAVSSILGVSVSGVMREGVALWNNTAGAVDGTLKIRTYEDAGARSEKLYKAVLKGDADEIARLYPDEEKAEEAVRKVVKEKYLAGEISKKEAREQIITYGGVKIADAYWVLKEWDETKETPADEDYSKYDQFYAAVETGAGLKGVIQEYTANGVSEETLRKQITNHFKPIYVDMSASGRAGMKGYLLNAMEACGQDRDKAELNLMKWDFESNYGYTWDDRGDAYRNGAITGSQLVREMMTISGKTQEQAELEVEVYDWQKDIPGCEITATGVRDYHENCETVGISRKTFYTAWRYYMDTSGEVDEETGESIPYSKVRKVLPYIGELDLTPEQKTALALCWWPASTVRKYKTW